MKNYERNAIFFWADAQKHNAQIFELTFLDW